MKLTTSLLLAGALAGAGFAAQAGDRAATTTPGQTMRDQGSAPGTTGASGYTPGSQMQDQGSVTGSPGASGYAPGQTKPDTGTTGMGGKDKLESDGTTVKPGRD